MGFRTEDKVWSPIKAVWIIDVGDKGYHLTGSGSHSRFRESLRGKQRGRGVTRKEKKSGREILRWGGKVSNSGGKEDG